MSNKIKICRICRINSILLKQNEYVALYVSFAWALQLQHVMWPSRLSDCLWICYIFAFVRCHYCWRLSLMSHCHWVACFYCWRLLSAIDMLESITMQYVTINSTNAQLYKSMHCISNRLCITFSKWTKIKQWKQYCKDKSPVLVWRQNEIRSV